MTLVTPSALAAAIAAVDSDWQLIPIGPSKRPIDPETGRNKDDWGHCTYDVDGITELLHSSEHVKAVGVVCGPPSGIIAVDFDGKGSTAKFLEVFGRPYTDLPRTVSWSSGRPNRRQLAFRVPSDLWPDLRGRRYWQTDDNRTVLELRAAGHQSVVAGEHPDTNGYLWINSPDTTNTADAPDWLLEPLYKPPHEPIDADYRQPTGADADRAVALLRHINPRDAYDPWLKVGMALHSVDDGLLSAWVDWSRGCSNFDEAECLAKWQSFKSSGITIGSLFHLAKEDGWQPKRDPIPDRITLPDAPSANGKQQTAAAATEDDEEPSYTDLLEAVLQAIEAQDIDAEMAHRAALGSRFRRNDDQVNAALFDRMRRRRVTPVQATSDSVQLSSIESLEYLIDGWIIRGQLHLTYGPAGTGKTTLCLAKALAVCRGTGLLDRSSGYSPANVLYIATDSGPEALRKAIEDLGAEHDPVLHSGPQQRLFIWADAPEQGQQAWCSDVPGMVRLISFIERYQIRYVLIDSAKAVTSRANVSYLSNESTATLLTFMSEVICRSLGCAIDVISHDGTASGSHSGAKAWSEIPSMVLSLEPIHEPDGSRCGVKAHFRKDRACTIDPGRKVVFDLNRETCELELAKGQEVVGNAEEAILQVLADAHAQDVASMSRRELLSAVAERFQRSARTVDNTMPSLLRRRLVVKPGRGRFALSPSAQMSPDLRRQEDLNTSLNYLSPSSGNSPLTPLATTGGLGLPSGSEAIGQSGNSLGAGAGSNYPITRPENGTGQSENPDQDWPSRADLPNGTDNYGGQPPGTGTAGTQAGQSHAPAAGEPVDPDYDEFADPEDVTPWDLT